MHDHYRCVLEGGCDRLLASPMFRYPPGMASRKPTTDLTSLEGIKAWLRMAVRDYKWNVRGIILDDGKVVPLPKEPAVVAKVIEVSVTEHFKRKAYAVPGLDLLDDLSGRGYPDVLLAGRAVDNKRVALDVKVARRRQPARGSPTVTQSKNHARTVRHLLPPARRAHPGRRRRLRRHGLAPGPDRPV